MSSWNFLQTLPIKIYCRTSFRDFLQEPRTSFRSFFTKSCRKILLQELPSRTFSRSLLKDLTPRTFPRSFFMSFRHSRTSSESLFRELLRRTSSRNLLQRLSPESSSKTNHSGTSSWNFLFELALIAFSWHFP